VPVEENEPLLAEVGLARELHKRAALLSGGQKRKLSVALALVGSPKLLILDECKNTNVLCVFEWFYSNYFRKGTSGMDVAARRHMWSLLQKNKHERTTMIVTHYMDEADILADRKAVMGNGRLRCAGTYVVVVVVQLSPGLITITLFFFFLQCVIILRSLFLKNRFGIGYTMSISCKNKDSVAKVSKFISKHAKFQCICFCVGVCNAMRTTNIELTLVELENPSAALLKLRLGAEASSAFPAFFQQLDAAQEKLQIIGSSFMFYFSLLIDNDNTNNKMITYC
jgi:energy-coupling factor transporter ATP-binding protein EcfA2